MTPTMRDSGVEYLDRIPEHWQVRPAVTLARVLTSTVDKKAYDTEVPVKLCNYTDVYYGTEIADSSGLMSATASREQIARFSLRGGDVPFTKDSETADDIGIPAYIPHDIPGTVYGYHLSVYRPHDLRYGRFLRYLLESNYAKTHFATKTPGVTRVGLSQATIRYFRVPTPPANEAVAIADFLDRETAQIDAFIAKNEELIALLTERRCSAIELAVSPAEPPPYWRSQQVRRLRPRSESGVSVNGYALPAQDGEIGVLRTGAVSKGFFDPSDNKRVVEEDADRVAAPVRAGTLLVNRANTPELVGCGVYVAESHPNLFLSDKLWQITFATADPAFMQYWTQTNAYRRQLSGLSVGASSSMQNLSYADFLSMVISIPPIEEQRDIVEELDRTTAIAAHAIITTRRAIDLARERRAALISAAVTGRIDVGVSA